MYDLIGDIHGHADELVRLLETLGYRPVRGVYRHPERKAIFLGDFIDRGPKIRETLDIARPMVEAGAALAVLGNHELNAIAYATEDRARPGEFLRRRNAKNTKQHAATLAQLKPQELADYLQWFRTLPLWLELAGLRVVHACWDERAIASIGLAHEQGKPLSDDFLQAAFPFEGPLYGPVETVLKGKYFALPGGMTFQDDQGIVRKQTRIRWYLSPRGHTYRSYALTNEIDCDLPLDASLAAEAQPYAPTAKPVFIGHYALKGRPTILAPNVACLDYGMAKGGTLCAYRWDGEQQLENERFVVPTDAGLTGK
ncbi:MAG: metallophosphoesterase [Planctomycetia bacterium]|nr:metallophosphoesterase [Planctomycetia bacterium]